MGIIRLKRGGVRKGRRHTIGYLALLICLAGTVAGCHKAAQEESQRFHLQGEVISVNVAEGYVEVKHGAIPGFMQAMTMPYPVENVEDLKRLVAGDEITADAVIIKGVPELENIVVIKKASENKK